MFVGIRCLHSVLKSFYILLRARNFGTQEGNRVVSGGADNAGRIYDLESGQSAQIAQHDAPIKSVRWFESPQGSIVVTGSWDKTLRVLIFRK